MTNPDSVPELPPLASDPPGVQYGVRVTHEDGSTQVFAEVDPTLEHAKEYLAGVDRWHPTAVSAVIVSRTVSPWAEVSPQ